MRKLSLLLLAAAVTAGLATANPTLNPTAGTAPELTKTAAGTAPTGAYLKAPAASTSRAVIYVDNFDGANDTSALKARGYLPYYRGTGSPGTTATWFQGNESVFPAYNGPGTGYVAANYNAVTGVNNIDSWLVLPVIPGGITAGDSLFFMSRAPSGSSYPDSIRVMYSVSDSVPEGAWTELGRFKVNTANMWELRGFEAPTTSSVGRFAIRYCVINGGPSGSNSDYIGIDTLCVANYVVLPNDIVMQSIDEPSTALVEPGLPFTPAATVHNPGTSAVTNFQVVYSIDDGSKAVVYEDTVDVAGPLDPDSSVQVTFADFTPAAFTEYNVTAHVTVAGDPNPGNDTLHFFFRTWDLDVGTAAILAPTGNVNPGASPDPQATFHNYGQQEADFDAYFEIYEGGSPIYGESVTINGLASGADTTVTFPNWTAPHNLGGYTAQAYTTMPYDLDPSNDTLAVGFNVSNAIWDQYAGTGPACASQNFEATYDAYDCWIADDFSVSGVDSALVDSISTGGGYWSGTGPVDSLYFAICTDSSGMPSFAQIIWQANITVFSDNAGNIEAGLPAPCMLQPGNYWLIHQGYMNYGTGGQYGWENRTPEAPIGSQGYFINPGGGFGSGTGWLTATTMGWGNVDFQFALWGESFITGVAGGPTGVSRASFSLMPNYPNPVHGRTNLSFSLPKSGAYEVTVYNVAGQAVDRMAGHGQAGINSVSWNASQATAGVYLYRLTSGGQSATRKLVVVK